MGANRNFFQKLFNNTEEERKQKELEKKCKIIFSGSGIFGKGEFQKCSSNVSFPNLRRAFNMASESQRSCEDETIQAYLKCIANKP